MQHFRWKDKQPQSWVLHGRRRPLRHQLCWGETDLSGLLASQFGDGVSIEEMIRRNLPENLLWEICDIGMGRYQLEENSITNFRSKHGALYWIRGIQGINPGQRDDEWPNTTWQSMWMQAAAGKPPDRMPMQHFWWHHLQPTSWVHDGRRRSLRHQLCRGEAKLPRLLAGTSHSLELGLSIEELHRRNSPENCLWDICNIGMEISRANQHKFLREHPGWQGFGSPPNTMLPMAGWTSRLFII